MSEKDDWRERIEDEVEKLHRAIYGTNGEIGLLGRVSNMEEKLSDIKKLAWVILTAVIGIVVMQIWQLVTAAGAGP